MQYQEYMNDDCSGNMVLDTMLHKPERRQDEKWSTGPQSADTYLMDFDLGSVRDFDCSLAFCFVEEELETNDGKLHKHTPADRVSCTKTNGGWQWTKCLEGRAELAVFEHPDECNVPQEPEVLSIDFRSNDWHGVVRNWDCEGFDYKKEELPEDYIPPHVLQAQRKTAQARRELMETVRLEQSAEKEKHFSAFQGLSILAMCTFPFFTMMACRSAKTTRRLKNMLPTRRQDGAKYIDLPVSSSDEEPLIV